MSTTPELPEPLEIDWPELHPHALGCGVEDRGLHDRYECAEYGWQDGIDKAIERVPEQIFDADQMRTYAQQCVEAATLPLQARIKELEAQLAAAKSKQFGQQIYRRQV